MIRSLSFLSPGNFPDGDLSTAGVLSRSRPHDVVHAVAPELGWRPAETLAPQ